MDDRIAAEVRLSQRSVAETVRNGGRLGPLDFAWLDTNDREFAAAGFEAWREISLVKEPLGKDRGWDRYIRPALGVLGLTTGQINRTTVQGARERDQQWIDLSGWAVAGDPIVPAFAPDSTNQRVLRLLLVTGQPAPDIIVSAVDRDRSSEPVLVLHPGSLGSVKRRELAEAFRRSRRTVIVLDDSLYAWLAASGPRRYENTMRFTLPFVHTNPYQADVAGLVPECMFYGRRDELAAILDRNGACYLYGGRQLGKSAILRHAERRFNSVDGQKAVYLDLKGAQIGMPRPPEAVWEALWKPLADVGVVSGEMPIARVAEAVCNAVEHWVKTPGRRLLILLDECDQMLEADATRNHLAVSARLKALMETTNRACKIVFAGLHTVQRFAAVENTPLAHLGAPVAIGPLDGAAAADLITRPLAAIGYRFADPELVNRILAHTARQPALTVIFCHHLLRRVSAGPRRNGEPPTPITAEDVDSTWADTDVASAIRQRVTLTLHLDPAYKVIAHVVAHAAQDAAGSILLTTDELHRECSYWWPAGFGGMPQEQFRLYAEEMIGLGVLAREGNRYGLRNPNVARLLGSPDDIETVLAEAHQLEPRAVFEPSQWRREITARGTDGAAGSETFRSPLTDAQLEQVTATEHGALLLVGTKANGIHRLIPTIEGSEDQRRKITVRAWNDPNIESMFRAMADDRHRIAVIDLRDADAVKAVSLMEAAVTAAKVAAAGHHPGKGTWSVLFVADAVADGPVVRHAVSYDSIPIISLQRWTAASIANFGRDAGYAFADADVATKVHEATGGWAYLVGSVARAARGADAFEASFARLDTGSLRDRVGLDRDPALRLAWDRVIAVVADTDESATDPDELQSIVAEDPEVAEALRHARMRHGLEAGATPGALVSQARLADLFAVTGKGAVWADPLLAR